MRHLVLLLCIGLSCVSAHALDLQLEGRRALVTGSTSGIGYSIAKALLDEGADVIVNGRSEAGVNAAIERLRKETGRTAQGFAADMSTADGASAIHAAFPDVEILVNNVGSYGARPFEQTTDEDWYRLIELNVMSGVRLSRLYLPGMRKRDWGRIIFISSESAYHIPPDSIQYGMTKAAQIAVARGLAEATAGTKITVNSVLPGPTRARPPGGKAADGRPWEDVERQFFTERRPTSLLKRFGHPDEIGHFVAFIASPLASATTGAALRADGGTVKSAF
ncbi:MAG: SDR family oxidoreductase [Steroidobacteraceae bacterium]|nr:SDR family oxidoreductase [Steroidobacteraceae bacterium]